MHRSRIGGFTVFELLIVLAVFSLIATAAGPKLATALRAATTRSAADQFVRASELARATAIRFGRVAELRVDATTARFWVEADTSGAGVRDTIGPLQNLTDAHVRIGSAYSVLCFDTRGLRKTGGACQSGTATIAFSMATRVDTVQITALGKVLR